MTIIEHKIINYILDYYSKTMFYPSYREISNSLERSISTIHEHMTNLERIGIIVRKCKDSPQYRLINIDFILKSRKEKVNG